MYLMTSQILKFVDSSNTKKKKNYIRYFEKIEKIDLLYVKGYSKTKTWQKTMRNFGKSEHDL